MRSRKKGKSGTRKYGRNLNSCAEYLREHRREKNKIRKIIRHLKAHPHDEASQKVVTMLREEIFGTK